MTHDSSPGRSMALRFLDVKHQSIRSTLHSSGESVSHQPFDRLVHCRCFTRGFL
ncbi:hypothetical protein OIU76_020677 [Salix suchowensis]|nr:hypothetical protein OIU76_020677 [Salix suchowensis]